MSFLKINVPEGFLGGKLIFMKNDNGCLTMDSINVDASLEKDEVKLPSDPEPIWVAETFKKR